jgi:iron complex transport system ATP-binding protein
MSEPSLVAAGARYTVNRATLIEDLDFHASPGEVVGVLGPNGAGKSTMLRLLSGELLPGAGSVTINGLSTAAASPGDLSRARSVLGQHVPTDIPYTVRSIVEMGRHPYRHDQVQSRDRDFEVIDDAMRRTGVSEFAGRVFATLSSGERLRVFLARVLAQEAPIVLLDEPTANLDVGHTERILAETRTLARSSHTVVSVFHDLNAAAFYCDRIYLLSEGRVRVTGSVVEVMRGDVLSEVFRQQMKVVEHPFRACPLVLVVNPEGQCAPPPPQPPLRP